MSAGFRFAPWRLHSGMRSMVVTHRVDYRLSRRCVTGILGRNRKTNASGLCSLAFIWRSLKPLRIVRLLRRKKRVTGPILRVLWAFASFKSFLRNDLIRLTCPAVCNSSGKEHNMLFAKTNRKLQRVGGLFSPTSDTDRPPLGRVICIASFANRCDDMNIEV